MTATYLFTDERTFWHSGGDYVLAMPVGGWVQPAAGAGFADSPDSKRRLLSLISVSGLAEKLEVRTAPAATEADLLRVHPGSYLQRFKELSDTTGGNLGIMSPFSRGGYEIAAVSAGLAIGAVDSVMEGKARNAYSLSRPAGHHCGRETPMGCCLLSNIPIAIEAARAKYGPLRVAIVDWDVHHGNGTQSIYYEDPNTLTISLHQDRCFPPGYGGAEDRGSGAGLGANINIPMIPGGGHDAYMYAVDRIVIPALNAFSPDLIVVASGLDASSIDPLSRMQLHSDSYRSLTQAMLDAANRLCKDRLVVVHEGGYAESYVPFCGLAIVEALSGVRTVVDDPVLDFVIAQQPNERFAKFQREWIDDLASLHIQ
jgi:acetoin utilization deacetylase AcuC-like enzyme